MNDKTNYEDISMRQGENTAGPSFCFDIQQIWCRKSDSLRTVNCTISLYKCSVITFSTVKDQPVTCDEKNLTNDSLETPHDPTNILSFTLRHRSPIGNQCVEVDKVLCLSQISDQSQTKVIMTI